MGADIKVKCLGCNAVVMFTRSQFEKNLKKIITIDNDKELSTDTKEIVNETKKGDIIVLKQEYACTNVSYHSNSYLENYNEWIIIDVSYEITIQCKGCGKIKKIPIDKYNDFLLVNKTRKSRDKKKNKILKEKLINEQKELIEKDNQWQINHFGKVLKNGDKILMRDKYICPNCGKSIYKVSNIEKYITAPVSIRCFSCSNTQNHSYDNNMNYIILERSKNGIKLDERIYINLFPENTKPISCPTCSHDAKLIQVSSYPKVFRIKCEYCENVKPISLDRIEFLKSIVDVREDNILQALNTTYKVFEDKNRIKFTTVNLSSIEEAVNYGKTILKLQLINSSNNHVTALHSIENRVVNIIYMLPNKKFQLIEYKCHFCKNCNMYFDFHNSFFRQINEHNLKLDRLYLEILNNKSDKEYQTQFDCLSGESILHSLGYRVGVNGLSTKQRRKLLKDVIEQDLLSISQMKFTINNAIKHAKNRPEYAVAVKEWQDDLNYINSFIK